MSVSLPFVRADGLRSLRLTHVVPRRTHREGARRLLNIVVGAVAIVLTLPLMLLIAALVRLTSRGPVLFTQARVGLDRRP